MDMSVKYNVKVIGATDKLHSAIVELISAGMTEEQVMQVVSKIYCNAKNVLEQTLELHNMIVSLDTPEQ
jgi:hypothetical protein